MFCGRSRARKEAKETFLKECIEDYEALMNEPFESAANVSELEKFHLQTKSQLLQDISTKWKNQNGSLVISSKMPTTLDEMLDGAFSSFKKAYLSRESEATTGQRNNSVSSASYDSQAEMDEAAKKDPAIGIDLGTTMCCVMVYQFGNVNVVENRPQGNRRTTPSYVTYHEDGSDSYGLYAKEDAHLNPENTIYDAKRMIGREWNDPNLKADMLKWPFEVVNDNNNPKIKTWNRTRFPHEVSARLLTMFRTMTEEHLNLPPGSVRKAVITVPAYFTEPQRRATNQAAECAGLEVLNILSEPTAAAIAYSWKRRATARKEDKNRTKTALIYDFGGGTFDVAIAKVTFDNVEILAVDGDTHLGGQDFDQKLMDYCIQQFQAIEGVDLEERRKSDRKQERDSTRSAMSRLKLQCEQVKERLTTSQSQIVNVERFYGDKHMRITVTKRKLEGLIKSLVAKTLDIVGRALENAREKGVSGREDIEDVILVGGSTRVPLVKEMLSDYFGGKQLCVDINADEAVAYGAAIQAAMLNNEKGMKRISVEDVTPFALGIRVLGGLFSPIITKNSKIPLSHTKQFATTEDFQTRICVKIYQGEGISNEMCDDNKQLGEFRLEGIPPNLKEMERIDVTMTIDSKGMLQVEAESCTSKKSKSITIKAERLGMDEGTIKKLKVECEEIALAPHHR